MNPFSAITNLFSVWQTTTKKKKHVTQAFRNSCRFNQDDKILLGLDDSERVAINRLNTLASVAAQKPNLTLIISNNTFYLYASFPKDASHSNGTLSIQK